MIAELLSDIFFEVNTSYDEDDKLACYGFIVVTMKLVKFLLVAQPIRYYYADII